MRNKKSRPCAGAGFQVPTGGGAQETASEYTSLKIKGFFHGKPMLRMPHEPPAPGGGTDVTGQ